MEQINANCAIFQYSVTPIEANNAVSSGVIVSGRLKRECKLSAGNRQQNQSSMKSVV